MHLPLTPSLFLLHLPVIKICLFILVLQAEEAVGAAGRYQLHGKMAPEVFPNRGAWVAQESRGQEVSGLGAANPQHREGRAGKPLGTSLMGH